MDKCYNKQGYDNQQLIVLRYIQLNNSTVAHRKLTEQH